MTNRKNLIQETSIQAILSLLSTCLMGWGFTYLATNIFRDYALIYLVYGV